MAWMLSCPKCGQPGAADDGHYLCRVCEGYPEEPMLRPYDEIERLTAERDRYREALMTARDHAVCYSVSPVQACLSICEVVNDALVEGVHHGG